MKQQKQESNGFVIYGGETRARKAVCAMAVLCEVTISDVTHSSLIKLITLEKDDLITLLGKAITKVGSNTLTSMYETEGSREELIKLADELTRTYISKSARVC